MRYAVLLLPLAACANYGVVDTWRGRSADDLAVAWGSPTSVQRLDDGRRILNYEQTSAYNGMTYHCRAWYVADRGGVITDTKVEGDNGGCSRLLKGRSAGR